MSVEEIIRVASLSSSLLISLIGFVVAVVKAIKNKKWDKLKNALQSFIAKAEGFSHYTGTEKKEIVLAWASNFCGENGIKFDATKVGNEIDELITLTKQVNQRERDKVITTQE